ncbi:hypothetical protein [Rhizobium sp. RU36D]|uniref:hypothetical protein n=1 Tax=Rhizobium sp. RU36D TaxID=1907415 RepID=UPI0009D8CBC0|nr:hypothetical protein [Rhizobium sp. RU36D]SMD14977.1 hypothetical protein SAMN05880593_1277 [Rhizobium sp. RU36D]
MNKTLVECSLIIIACITGLANYAGLTLTAGAHDWWTKGFFAIVALGVTTFTYVVWHGAFAVAPKLPLFRHRARGWGTTLAACALLLGVSSFLNVAAFGGAEAIRYGYEETVVAGEKALADASTSGGDLTGLRSSLSALAGEAASLSSCEVKSGCVSGGRGAGGISATLDVLANTVAAQVATIDAAEQALAAKREEGKACLVQMRQAVSATSVAGDRDKMLAAGIDCLNAVIGNLHGTDIAADIRQSMAGIVQGTLIPASVKTDKQKQAVSNIMASMNAKAQAIADTIGAKDTDQSFEPVSMPVTNASQAVVLHWKAVVPAWITGIALDLLPLILLSFEATLMASRRASPDDAVLDWPVRELMAAKFFLNDVNAQGNMLTLRANPPVRSKAGPRSYGPDEHSV